ncbi:MAG: AGE family epimerase/isomerase [Lachnospiraceae bacterium]|nr:AGE family epimerase/isomerase [Lachnospiraceae bacterium]
MGIVDSAILKQEVSDNLKDMILPYWEDMEDNVNGGFFGYKDFDLILKKDAPKGVILNSRILYFFARAAKVMKMPELREYADHAYEFLKDSCLDVKNGGLYWMIHSDGTVLEDMKHTYNQAFGIYALSAYYDAFKSVEALDIAIDIFDLIEKNCRDKYGYKEAFTADFKEIDNEKLSENGLLAQKTMNTLLHLLEGYSYLYEVSHIERVGNALKDILEIFEKKVWNESEGRLEVFFDEKMNSIADLYSYGHDIEASWLIDHACKVLGIKPADYTLTMAENVYRTAFVKNKVLNECFNGEVNETRVWWIQAESMVGFLNAYEKTNDGRYLTATAEIWSYIKKYFLDRRPGGEWFWDLDKKDEPSSKKPITEPWKCPYHNGRMCMELIERIH